MKVWLPYLAGSEASAYAYEPRMNNDVMQLTNRWRGRVSSKVRGMPVEGR